MIAPNPMPTRPTQPNLQLPHDAPPILVFDVETNGGSPQLVCQLGFVLAREGVVHEGSWIFQLPDGEPMTWRAFDVHHIRLSTCKEEGHAPRPIIEYFLCKAHEVLKAGGFVVAHNKGGDVSALRNTAQRWECPFDLEVRDVYCTQANSTCFSPYVKKDGRRKPFKNAELYRYFYASDPDWAKLHDALDDVKITFLNMKAMMESGRVSGCRIQKKTERGDGEEEPGEVPLPRLTNIGTDKPSRFFAASMEGEPRGAGSENANERHESLVSSLHVA